MIKEWDILGAASAGEACLWFPRLPWACGPTRAHVGLCFPMWHVVTVCYVFKVQNEIHWEHCAYSQPPSPPWKHAFFFIVPSRYWLPRWCNDKEPVCQWRRCERHKFDPWVGKIPWRRVWQPTLVFLLGESHGHRRLWSVGSQRVEHDWSDFSHMHPFVLRHYRLELPI